MYSTLNGVQGNGVVGSVGRENGDYAASVEVVKQNGPRLTGTAFGERVNCRLVGIGVRLPFLWELFK